MKFLDSQLEKLRGLELPTHATAEELTIYNKQIGKGERLLAKHGDHFDVRDFYLTQDVCTVVENICECLQETIEDWGMRSAVRVESRVPRACVEEDEELLNKLLNYILKDVRCDVEPELQQRWEVSKMRHRENVKQLEVIDEDELHTGARLGQGGQGAVFKAQFHGTSVAVKKPIRDRGDLPIVEFARFFREVVIHGILSHHPCVVQLLATTVSGWIVMELADTDLHTLCSGKERLSWRFKARLLQQGATGLAYIYSRGRVHGDVKPQNYLVFGNQPENCRVKISDFGMAFETAQSRSKTVRLGGGTPHWIAPELYDGQPISQKSDVYSFGVVLFEVVSQRHPFGGEATTEYAIMAKKVRGEEPCAVCPQDCPPQALELMRQCCALDPVERPTMEEVSSCLLHLPEDWSAEEAVPPPFPQNAAPAGSLARTTLSSSRSSQGPTNVEHNSGSGELPEQVSAPSGKQLLEAAKKGNLSVVMKMLDNGVDINTQDHERSTPLTFAAMKGRVEVIEALLALGADVNHLTRAGATALSQAARYGREAVCRRLLDCGATVDVPNVWGRTELMAAAEAGHTPVVQLLLDSGATVELADKYGNNALHYAALTGELQVVNILLQKGVDISIRNEEGSTAANLASYNNHPEVAELINGWAKPS